MIFYLLLSTVPALVQVSTSYHIWKFKDSMIIFEALALEVRDGVIKLDFIHKKKKNVCINRTV